MPKRFTYQMPFGKQFSPTQVNLARLLTIAQDHDGSKDGIESEILRAFFTGRPKGQREKLAMNTRLAMQEYKLLDEHCRLTAIGRELLALRGEPEKMYIRFAQHLLEDLHGIQLIQAIRYLTQRGESPTAARLSQVLAEWGIDAGGKTGEKLNPIRLWLAGAGIFEEEARGAAAWQVSNAQIERVLDVSIIELEELAALSVQQREFLKAMASLTAPPPYRSNEVAKLAEQQSDVAFDWKQLREKVVKPLEDAAYLTARKPTGGRGGKAFVVEPTDKFRKVVRKPLLEALAKTADVRVPLLERPLNELIDALDNPRLPTAQKGQLLEAVALHLVRLMGLRFKRWRVRGAETGGAEVDLVADHLDGKFARYQFQCKHRGTVDAQHVDREVGVANKLNSNVIVMVTTGKVTQGARQSADQHMRRSSIAIIFIDGSALRRIRQREGEIVHILEREFERVTIMKNLARLGEL